MFRTKFYPQGYITVPPRPVFTVSYNAYIPVDHILGPTFCTWSGGGGTPQNITKIYMGDANRGTYRTAEQIETIPDGQQGSNFFQGTGQTRNYGKGSPANGSTLSSLDEDGIPNDCYLWNAAGQATANFSYDVTYPFPRQAQVHFDGAASNPLENQAASITWDMRTVLSTANPTIPTAYVDFYHTCYPAHQIKVNGTTVYSFVPPQDDPAFITGCLLLHENMIGPAQTNPVSVPTQ